MSISDSPVARRLRAVAATSPAERAFRLPAERASPERKADAPARPIRTDRLEVCPDCEAFIAGDGPLPGGRDPELREIERGVARLGIARGDQRVTMSITGERIGHRAVPCGCCRRPVAGHRAVVERAVWPETGPEAAD